MTWNKGNLGDLTTILSGTTPKSEVKAFWNGTHTWITPTDLGKLKGFLIHNSERSITDEGIKHSNLSLIPKGAVVMSSRAPIGHLGIAGRDFYTNQGCKSFVCGSKIDNEFLYYTLLHRMKDIQELGSGATFVEVSKSALQGFEISYPDSISEQRRIASKLKAQFSEVAQALKTALLQVIEVKKLRKNALLIQFKKFDPFQKIKMGECCSFSCGGTPDKSNIAFWKGSLPWFSPKDMKSYYLTNSIDKVTRLAIQSSAARLVPANTILVVNRSGVLAHTLPVGIIQQESTFNQDIKAITPNKYFVPDFIALFLKSMEQTIIQDGVKVGPTVHSLKAGYLENLEIPKIDIQTQKEFCSKLLEMNEIENNALKATSIMHSDLVSLSSRLLAQTFNY
jgi:restriction endonuclease S subunit